MSKKKKSPDELPPILIQNSTATLLNQNGQYFGNGNIPLPFGGIGPGGSLQQVEDTTTIFENLRWYLVSNIRQVLSQSFVEIGLVQTIVCVPVDDALRGGIMIKSKQLSEDEIKQLHVKFDREDGLGTAGWAAKWERLFGGAGILTFIDDQDPEMPLDIKSISKDSNITFRDVDMWELFNDKQNVEGYIPDLHDDQFEYYTYYAENIHKSSHKPPM